MTALVPCVVDTVTFPVTLSEAEGLKAKFKDAFCPGVRVIGVEIPLAVTSLALTVTWESVTLEFPLLVMVTLLELELPALTLPKLTLLGLGEIVTKLATPVPVRVAEFGELGASLEMLTLPPRVPAVAGANRTLNEAVCPTPRFVGVFKPLAL